MELFVMHEMPGASVADQGQAINGATSISWIERYQDPGEVKIIAPLSSGIRDVVPIGSFVSHTETKELMVIENHVINEDIDVDPTIEISGRSISALLDQRVVGIDQARAGSYVSDYEMTSASAAYQAALLINDHVVNPTASVDQFPNIQAVATITSATSEARAVAKASILSGVLGILAVDDLGLRSVRYTMHDNIAEGTRWLVHDGDDRTDSVIFSWKSGDLNAADYLWSSKTEKNAALVIGRYIHVLYVTTGVDEYDRRYMIVDGSDIDGHLDSAPINPALITIRNRMTTRGRQAIRNQPRTIIGRADVSDTSNFRYRRDYNIGDLVTVDGNFGQIGTMRVTEYAEIQDENGESGHPTLSIPGESI